jgi:hypothetical protein
VQTVKYLNILKSYLRLDPGMREEVLREFEGHIEDRVHDLEEEGLTQDEAFEKIAKILGPPKLVAQQIYEVYSQGTWRQSFFAALPHFLIAILFAMHWWQHTFWLSIILILSVGAVIYGWCHGKPTWLFPWLGYLLFPVIIIGVLFIYLPGNWTIYAALAYFPIAVTMIFLVARQTLKKDWLFVSLMLLPLPIVLGWVIALQIDAQFMQYEEIHEAAPWIALSFAVLALTVAVFIRVKKRWIKTGALLIPVILILLIVALDSRNALNFWGWLILALLTGLNVLIPALLEGATKRSRFEHNIGRRTRLRKDFSN